MKKSSTKNKQTILIIWIFLTALLLSMTTYAWFSSNSIFEVESFDIQVATKGGLQISTDAINWKGVVGMLDFMENEKTYPENINQIPNNVQPVSTAGDIENSFLKMYDGEIFVGKNITLASKRIIEKKGLGKNSNGNFVAFDIFIKSPSPKFLTLDALSGISYLNNQSSGIENAFRIAFIKMGTVSEDSGFKQAQSLLNGNKAYIWEVNAGSHNTHGIENAQNIYGLTISDNDKAIPYDGVKADIPSYKKVKVSEANSSYYPEYFSKVIPDMITYKNNNNLTNLFNIDRGITKIRVYVWLEGQDVDCEDKSNYGNLAIDLRFVAQ